ncbi:MAG TPA: ribonuclease J, partial [Candidatus Saccharibacteria bacterium]|nr:ribonuclease J [Candidatus Saccharibacteria bacterium]
MDSNNKQLNSRPLTAQDLQSAGRTNTNNARNKSSSPKAADSSNTANGNFNKNKIQNNNHNKSNNNNNNPKRGNNNRRKNDNYAMRRRHDKGPAVFSEGSFNADTSRKQIEAPKPVTMSKTDAGKLKIIPLGGLDKIGKNMMALEYENDIIVMDLGFMFPGPDMPGIDYIIPDTKYLEERKHKIRAHLITHAHEDHVGGIPFILPKLPAPIYGAQFTIKFIERKLEEYKLPFKPDLRMVNQDSGEKIQLGAFSVEFIR